MPSDVAIGNGAAAEGDEVGHAVLEQLPDHGAMGVGPRPRVAIHHKTKRLSGGRRRLERTPALVRSGFEEVLRVCLQTGEGGLFHVQRGRNLGIAGGCKIAWSVSTVQTTLAERCVTLTTTGPPTTFGPATDEAAIRLMDRRRRRGLWAGAWQAGCQPAAG